MDLLSRAAEDGFDEGTRWIAAAGFTEEELATVARTFEIPHRSPEPERWIEWLGEIQPGGKTDNRIRYLVSKWTLEDHRAVGEWLAAMPETATRTSAIRGFVDAVAPHEPASAMQWAAVLPEEHARKCAGQVFESWLKRDAQDALGWLSSAPDGLVRHTAARAYVELIFLTDQNAAMQWLVTVPPGPERDETLQRLYKALPKDSAADRQQAEAFADVHGVTR